MSATRPTFAMLAMLAMPCTTVQKMIGAMSTRIALMKASPSGSMRAPSIRIKSTERNAGRHRDQHQEPELQIERPRLRRVYAVRILPRHRARSEAIQSC